MKAEFFGKKATGKVVANEEGAPVVLGLVACWQEDCIGTKWLKLHPVTLEDRYGYLLKENTSDTLVMRGLGDWGVFSDLHEFEIGGYAQDMYHEEGRPVVRSAQFKPYGVATVRRAEAIVAVLKRIERYEEKQLETNGHPANWGQWAARVAQAVGVSYVGFEKTVTPHSKYAGWHSENYMWYAPGLAAGRLEEMWKEHAADRNWKIDTSR